MESKPECSPIASAEPMATSASNVPVDKSKIVPTPPGPVSPVSKHDSSRKRVKLIAAAELPIPPEKHVDSKPSEYKPSMGIPESKLERVCQPSRPALLPGTYLPCSLPRVPETAFLTGSNVNVSRLFS